MTDQAITNVFGGYLAAQRRATESRTERYCRRVDEHIAGLSPGASLGFLRAELAKWFARYETFQARVFAGENLESDATAWDYAETIAALGAKIARLERQQAVSA